MKRYQQPKTGNEMQRVRKGRNIVVLAIIFGMVLLFYVLTLVKIGTAS